MEFGTNNINFSIHFSKHEHAEHRDAVEGDFGYNPDGPRGPLTDLEVSYAIFDKYFSLRCATCRAEAVGNELRDIFPHVGQTCKFFFHYDYLTR